MTRALRIPFSMGLRITKSLGQFGTGRLHAEFVLSPQASAGGRAIAVRGPRSDYRPILHRTNETETRLGARACSVAMRFRKGFRKTVLPFSRATRATSCANKT